jgi:DMSO/TMAO reductase YedYZ molybdopterin-dependent catalytic subunit
MVFSRAQLMALPQYTQELPIACVEGWSTTQTWTGVRVVDLARMVGVQGDATLTSISLDHGNYGAATLAHEQVSDPRTLLALQVNGRPLPLDHGYPARIISPAVPGVHCTKWVTEMHFAELRA